MINDERDTVSNEGLQTTRFAIEPNEDYGTVSPSIKFFNGYI